MHESKKRSPEADALVLRVMQEDGIKFCCCPVPGCANDQFKLGLIDETDKNCLVRHGCYASEFVDA